MRRVVAGCEGGRMSNLETVQSIYAAFGRGDVPTMLAFLSEDIAWEYQPIHTDVPWLQARRGITGAGEFFQAVGRELRIEKFGVNQLLANERTVVALVDIEFVVAKTGKRVREVDEVHVWHFDAGGKVAKFRHATDTHQQQLAWHG
jgi:ketosteroid isomerase-like protein